MQVCSGLPISQGLAAGKIVFLGAQKAAVRQAVSPQEEQLRFESAQRQAVDALGALYEKARAELGEKDAEIFSVHQLMAEDEDFTDLVSEAIADGAEAAEAVRQAGSSARPCFPPWTTTICVNAPPMCGTSPPASAAF
ncbi:MAG: phosphoenolpyruvate-utilizing N-terminal domain-containing protein [Acutalibacteraceae bacterium]